MVALPLGLRGLSFTFSHAVPETDNDKRMKIYMKTGDRGETSLYGGKRLPKDNPRIDAYGAVDELNSCIGICRSLNSSQELDRILDDIQRSLFTLGADLATPLSEGKPTPVRIQEQDVTRLEDVIDRIDPTLEPLRNFILPGGSRSAAMLHCARTVCRRAERAAVRLMREEDVGEIPVKYLNRLSDALFVLARWVNALAGTKEVRWDRER